MTSRLGDEIDRRFDAAFTRLAAQGHPEPERDDSRLRSAIAFVPAPTSRAWRRRFTWTVVALLGATAVAAAVPALREVAARFFLVRRDGSPVPHGDSRMRTEPDGTTVIEVSPPSGSPGASTTIRVSPTSPRDGTRRVEVVIPPVPPPSVPPGPPARDGGG